jgi:hypothetical protein
MSIISHQTRGTLTAKNSLGDAVLMLELIAGTKLMEHAAWSLKAPFPNVQRLASTTRSEPRCFVQIDVRGLRLIGQAVAGWVFTGALRALPKKGCRLVGDGVRKYWFK